MRNEKIKYRMLLIIGFLFIVIMFACTTSNKLKEAGETSEKSGFIKWKENCSRCHNIPSPSDYTDEQWEIIGSHMRVRAYLTQKETEEIVLFLKGIN